MSAPVLLGRTRVGSPDVFGMSIAMHDADQHQYRSSASPRYGLEIERDQLGDTLSKITPAIVDKAS